MKRSLAVAAIVLLCGCIYSPGSEDKETSTTTLRRPQNVSNQTVVVLHNVGEALFMWSPFMCNFSNSVRLGTEVKTQMWMDKGRYHAVVDRKTHVINDGVYVYVWMDDHPAPGAKYMISEIKGLREHIEKAEVKNNRTVAIPTGYMDLAGAINVSCQPATLPDGVFVPQKRTFQPGEGGYDYSYDSKLDKYGKT